MRKLIFALVALAVITINATSANAGIANEKMYPKGETSETQLTADGYKLCNLDADGIWRVEGDQRNGKMEEMILLAGTPMVCHAETGEYTHIRECSNRVQPLTDDTGVNPSTCCSGNIVSNRGRNNVTIGGSVNVVASGDHNNIDLHLAPPMTNDDIVSGNGNGDSVRVESQNAGEDVENSSGFSPPGGWIPYLLGLLALAAFATLVILLIVWLKGRNGGDEDTTTPAPAPAEPLRAPEPVTAQTPEAPTPPPAPELEEPAETPNDHVAPENGENEARE